MYFTTEVNTFSIILQLKNLIIRNFFNVNKKTTIIIHKLFAISEYKQNMNSSLNFYPRCDRNSIEKDYFFLHSL